jgi:hypothetical protein
MRLQETLAVLDIADPPRVYGGALASLLDIVALRTRLSGTGEPAEALMAVYFAFVRATVGKPGASGQPPFPGSPPHRA